MVFPMELCTVVFGHEDELDNTAVNGPLMAVVGVKTALPSQVPKQVGYEIPINEKVVCEKANTLSAIKNENKIFFMSLSLNSSHYF